MSEWEWEIYTWPYSGDYIYIIMYMQINYILNNLSKWQNNTAAAVMCYEDQSKIWSNIY